MRESTTTARLNPVFPCSAFEYRTLTTLLELSTKDGQPVDTERLPIITKWRSGRKIGEIQLNADGSVTCRRYMSEDQPQPLKQRSSQPAHWLTPLGQQAEVRHSMPRCLPIREVRAVLKSYRDALRVALDKGDIDEFAVVYGHMAKFTDDIQDAAMAGAIWDTASQSGASAVELLLGNHHAKIQQILKRGAMLAQTEP